MLLYMLALPLHLNLDPYLQTGLLFMITIVLGRRLPGISIVFRVYDDLYLSIVAFRPFTFCLQNTLCSTYSSCKHIMIFP